MYSQTKYIKIDQQNLKQSPLTQGDLKVFT